MSYHTERHAMPSTSRGRTIGAYVGIGLLGAVGLMTLFGGFYTVHQTERAVVTRNGAFKEIAGPGFHLKVPFIDDTLDFPVALQAFTIKHAEAYTIDNQPVMIDMEVQYQIPETEIERIFFHVRDYEQRLNSSALALAKEAFGKRNINDVPNERGPIAADVLQRLKTDAKNLYGIDVQTVRLVDLQYSDNFRKAIDQAAIAKAAVERAQQELRRTNVEAETAASKARGEASAAFEAAQGRAKSQRVEAEAGAEAIRLKGAAEAEAMHKQAEALGQNPLLVELRRAERWNGVGPVQVIGGSGGNSVVPLFDVTKPPQR